MMATKMNGYTEGRAKQNTKSQHIVDRLRSEGYEDIRQR